MEFALKRINRKVKGKPANVAPKTCFEPVDGDQLTELRGMGACRKATEEEVALHEARNKTAKKAPAKKSAAKKEPEGGAGKKALE